MAWQPDYCDIATANAYLRIGDNVDNPELALAITAASRTIDRATGRQFGVTASVEQRTYECRWSRTRSKWRADIDDIMTAAGLVVTVSGAATTDYTLFPLNATEEGRPWERIYVDTSTPATLGGPPTILVDATYGWTTVPDTIKQACLLQSSRYFKRRESPYGVAGSPEFGNELRLLSRLDPDVDLMVRPYRRLTRAGLFA